MDIPMTDHDVVALEEFGKGFMHYMSRVRALLAYCRAVTAERDAAIEDRDSWRHAEQTFREETEEKEKDAAESLARVAAQLAALKKRVADAEKTEAQWFGDNVFVVNHIVSDKGPYALLRLEDGK